MKAAYGTIIVRNVKGASYINPLGPLRLGEIVSHRVDQTNVDVYVGNYILFDRVATICHNNGFGQGHMEWLVTEFEEGGVSYSVLNGMRPIRAFVKELKTNKEKPEVCSECGQEIVDKS